MRTAARHGEQIGLELVQPGQLDYLVEIGLLMPALRLPDLDDVPMASETDSYCVHGQR
jgi:hypothetical protein